jgi:N-methylhydantoinase B
MNVTVCLNDGDTHNSPIESGEMKSPMVVREYALRQDSGGAGRQRGGLGLTRTIEAQAPLTVNSQIERTQCLPWGLDGGKEALGNRIFIKRADGSVQQPPNGKLYNVQLQPGDAYVIESGGGGGFGDPLERDPELVARDVRLGYVSAAKASEDYGVEIDEASGAKRFGVRARSAAF